MCFRLLAAVRHPSGATVDRAIVTQRAFDAGLDLRASDRVDFVELAQGDCACALYTKPAGRGRVAGFADGLRDEGLVVRMFFVDDDDPTTEIAP